MKNRIKKLTNIKVLEKVIIVIASIILIYFLASIYFTKHFFFNTVINGVDVSLKKHKDAEQLLRDKVQEYQLLIVERDHETEIITAQEIGLTFNENNNITNLYQQQEALEWVKALFKDQNYNINNMYSYNENSLFKKINALNCLNKTIEEPKNVSFVYYEGSYEIKAEKHGNRIIKDKLIASITAAVLSGKPSLDLNDKACYKNPKFTVKSPKTLITWDLLNKYVSTKVYYQFGTSVELLDGNIIHNWLSVNDNLDVIILEDGVKEYINMLGEMYDTVGITREFKTSVGKVVEVKGGIYGWKINQDAEVAALIQNINLAEEIKKEPIYTLKALTREGNEIGNTYIEINITRQFLWFYKDGKLVTGGPIVTGNPSRGYATVLGAYSVVYKQKNATLSGPGYEAPVTYWMPFFGNMGVHDATWRHSFGGDIYKRRGSHGCVNAPYQLAKTIFENIDEGTPVICYEE